MQLVSADDPILKTKLEKFDFSNPPTDPIKLYNDMGQALIKWSGLGLAANQVGLPYRFFVMRTENIIGCFNPILVDQSSEEILLEEGCLTIPNLYVKIKRSKKIKVRYIEPNGEIVTKVFDGMTARIWQHEYDHVNGILFTSRATYFHLEQAKNKARRMKKFAAAN